MIRIGVLVSGTGSNLQALIDELHGSAVEIAAVCSNRAEAGGLELARSAGIETGVFDDQLAMGRWLVSRSVRLVVCAGYMRILPPAFLELFDGKVINVHPSLLPAFKGAHAIEDALAAGVGETGVTVHWVDHGVDTGPTIAQERVAVNYSEMPEALRARIQAVEHRILPATVRKLARELEAVEEL